MTGILPAKGNDLYYKVFRQDGWDFQTGHTINYGASIGKVVRVPDDELQLPVKICSRGLIHALKDITDTPRYIEDYPFRLAIVEGTPIADEREKDSKVGAKEWLFVEEVLRERFDELYGLRWSALEKLTLNPTTVAPQAVTDKQRELLGEWAGLWGLWGLWGLRDLWDLWDLRDLRDLRGLQDLWGLGACRTCGTCGTCGACGTWGLQFAYLVSEVLTERERWLTKHTYVIPGCTALIDLVREGFVPTFDYEAKQWILWHYVDGKWKEDWKGKVDASAKTRELNEKYEEATR